MSAAGRTQVLVCDDEAQILRALRVILRDAGYEALPASTGDEALVSVARALRDTTDDTALICRSGGEEFVIADIWHPDEVQLRAQQLCDVIAALPFGVTASIGTAGIHPAHPAGDSVDLLAELIAAKKLRPQIAVEAPWNEIGSVARRLIEREFTGKAVLRVV